MVILTLLLGRVKQCIYLLQIESEYNAPLPTGHPSIANIYYTRTTHAHDTSRRASFFLFFFSHVTVSHQYRKGSEDVQEILLGTKPL